MVKVRQRDRKYALLLNEDDLWKFCFDLITFFYGKLNPRWNDAFSELDSSQLANLEEIREDMENLSEIHLQIVQEN